MQQPELAHGDTLEDRINQADIATDETFSTDELRTLLGL